MAYTMVIYHSNVSDGFTLPYVPAGGFSVTSDQDVKSYEGAEKNYTVPKTVSPKEFTIKLIWPSSSRAWMHSASVAEPHRFVVWAENYRRNRAFFHCIVTDSSGSVVISGCYLMKKLDWDPMQNGDFDISMGFVEFHTVFIADTGNQSGTGTSTGNKSGKSKVKVTAESLANEFVGAAKIAQKSASKMRTQVKNVITAAKKKTGYSTTIANKAASLAIAIMKDSKYSSSIRELFYKTYKNLVNTRNITLSALTLEFVQAATMAGTSESKMKVKVKAVINSSKKKSGYSKNLEKKAAESAVSQMKSEKVSSTIRTLFTKTFNSIAG